MDALQVTPKLKLKDQLDFRVQRRQWRRRKGIQNCVVKCIKISFPRFFPFRATALIFSLLLISWLAGREGRGTLSQLSSFAMDDDVSLSRNDYKRKTIQPSARVYGQFARSSLHLSATNSFLNIILKFN